jgi:hypothetical protein
MILFPNRLSIPQIAAASLLIGLQCIHIQSQQVGEALVIQNIDSAVKARLTNVAGYTVTEHYAVFRGKDEAHPAAEMTVETTYTAESGKSYKILSESGSDLIRTFVFKTLLENEERINLPANRAGAWITSANYEMKLKPGETQIDGRNCFVLSLTPRRKEPFLIAGTLWVDAKDGSIVQVQGISSKSPSMWTGPTQMIRQYANINGFSQATHARAVSNSSLLGQSIIKIDYSDYSVQLRSPK